MIRKLILIAFAGGIGTLARYGLSGAVQRIGGSAFPWGTLSINVIGCLSAGFIWSLFESRWQVSPDTRTILIVGFLGAFTTFSAYILETGELVRGSEWTLAAANIAMQNVLGFVSLFAGSAFGRMV